MIGNLTRMMSPSSSGSSSVPVDNRVRKIIKHPLARQKFNVFLQPPRKLAASLTMSEEVPSAWDSRTFEKLHSGDQRVKSRLPASWSQNRASSLPSAPLYAIALAVFEGYEETFIRAAEQARPGGGGRQLWKPTCGRNFANIPSVGVRWRRLRPN